MSTVINDAVDEYEFPEAKSGDGENEPEWPVIPCYLANAAQLR